jgi:hypothetical protein
VVVRSVTAIAPEPGDETCKRKKHKRHRDTCYAPGDDGGHDEGGEDDDGDNERLEAEQDRGLEHGDESDYGDRRDDDYDRGGEHDRGDDDHRDND